MFFFYCWSILSCFPFINLHYLILITAQSKICIPIWLKSFHDLKISCLTELEHGDSNAHQSETCTEVTFWMCLHRKPSVGDGLIVYSSLCQLLQLLVVLCSPGCCRDVCSFHLNAYVNFTLMRKVE